MLVGVRGGYILGYGLGASARGQLTCLRPISTASSMADPFEALGSIGGAPPSLSELGSPPLQQQQQQGAPRPGWPGMNGPSAGTATFAQQHHQPQYPPSVGDNSCSHFAGNSGGFHQQQNIIMGRGNLTAQHPQQQQQPLPGASAGYAMYQAGPQQQQQHVAATTPATTSWGMGSSAAPTSVGMFQQPQPTATGATWKPPPGVAPYAQHSSTGPAAPPAAAAATAAVATTATPEPAKHINTGAGGVGGGSEGGAEWAPPADQMVSYQEMWTAASAGCPVPGTVSGRAAVQFFSRSGLPKDALKTVRSTVACCWKGGGRGRERQREREGGRER